MRYAILLAGLLAVGCKTGQTQEPQGAEVKNLDNPFKPRLSISPFTIDGLKIQDNGLVDAGTMTAALELECHKLGDLLGGGVFEVVTKEVPLEVARQGEAFTLKNAEHAELEAQTVSAKSTCAAKLRFTFPDLSVVVDFVASDTILPFSTATGQVKKNVKDATLAVVLEPQHAGTTTVCSRHGKYITGDGKAIRVWSDDKATADCPAP